jgi:hypothetical protein
VERYLIIWCPELLEQNEEGRERRAFDRVLNEVSSLATRIETVRPGVCAVPTRGPSRYFGGDRSFSSRVSETVSSSLPDNPFGIGVADGLFAATLAARSAISRSAISRSAISGPSEPLPPVLIPPGGTPAFLAPWPVGVLDRPELVDLLVRLGIRTLGQFSALPPRDVLARFGTDGVACHSTAAGRSGELPGLRVPTSTSGPTDGSGDPGPVNRQPGFWGGTAEADIRARGALARIQSKLGPEEVLVGRLQGGRAPSDRARLVPADTLGGANPNRPDDHRPWPGRLPAPSPSVVLTDPQPVEVVDASGDPVAVSARVLLSSPPARVSIAGGTWDAVAGWAGPWPTDDLWWSDNHRRRARIQVVTASGAAILLAAEGRSWWLEGIYD